MMESVWNYQAIKALAKATKGRITDLIALSPGNDPFYCGTPGDLEMGEWFAQLWKRYHRESGARNGVHLRRLHYWIVSQSKPVKMPNGLPYENTEGCWDILGKASTRARYLELVSASAFDDKRNHEPIIEATDEAPDPYLWVNNNADEFAAELPGLPNLPDYQLGGYKTYQPYHLEIWCEKTTMDDVLMPLCKRYQVNLVRGIGELSITATLEMVKRLELRGKPARILYISDFDPAGKSMPVAVARKGEYFILRDDLDIDLRLFPLVLNEDQVQRYNLPRIPIKETELRKSHFEQVYGAGATELDALEALRPGELGRIVESAIRQYYDEGLSGAILDTRATTQAELEEIRQDIIADHQDEIEEIREDYARLEAELSNRFKALADKINNLWQAISEELEEAAPDLSERELPQGREAVELGEGLYNSRRTYLAQLAAYKAFQGKSSYEEKEVA